MNFLDYLLAMIIAYCLVRGIFRGLVKEFTSIIGVLAGFYFAYTYYPQVAELIKTWIAGRGYANILAFLILFVGVYLVISIAGMVIKYLMNIAFLGWADRTLGAVFGAIKGVLIVAVMVAMLTTFLSERSIILKESLLVRRVSGLSSLMIRAASADMKNIYAIHIRELQKDWHRAGK